MVLFTCNIYIYVFTEKNTNVKTNERGIGDYFDINNIIHKMYYFAEKQD